MSRVRITDGVFCFFFFFFFCFSVPAADRRLQLRDEQVLLRAAVDGDVDAIKELVSSHQMSWTFRRCEAAMCGCFDGKRRKRE